MADGNTYRNELKYQISYSDYLAINQRLRTLMKPDEHVGADGTYIIRSIYFDNAEDKALKEKVNGIQKREKFRIRYYNDDFSYISLEKKIKHNGLCMKLDARLTKDECESILQNDIGFMINHKESLVRELYYKMKTIQLRPKVLVSYVREPYVYNVGNVRVTFDRHIRTGLFHRAFLEDELWDMSVSDNPGDMILEVKYDEFLPEIIMKLLQTENVRVQAFSKYAACRRFG